MLESLAHGLGLDKIGRAALCSPWTRLHGALFDFICLGGTASGFGPRGPQNAGIGKSGQTGQPS